MKKTCISFLALLLCLMVFAAPAALADGTTVTFSQSSVTLRVGESRTLTAAVTPAQSLTYTSENTAVCAIGANGSVTALQPGYSVISATAADGTVGRCLVVVGNTATSMNISDTTLSLHPGDTHLLIVSVVPDDNTRQDISWVSNNPNVATVDYNGRVRAQGVGKATITASAQNGSVSVSCAVTVANPQAPAAVTAAPAAAATAASTAKPAAAATATPKPAAATQTPAAESSSGQKAYVVTTGGRLNVRAAKQNNAKVIGRIKNGAEVTVLAYGDTWCHIRSGSIKGYVKTEFLSVEKPAATAAPTAAPTEKPAELPTGSMTSLKGNTARVTVKGNLNMRVKPDKSARRVCLVPQNAVVEIILYGKEWCYASYNDQNGYVMTQYLSIGGGVNTSNTGEATADQKVKTAKVVTNQGGLNLRKTASVSSQRLLIIPQGARVQVLSKDTQWAYVNYNGRTGYVQTAYLQMD